MTSEGAGDGVSVDLNRVLAESPERLDLVVAEIALIDPAGWEPEQVVAYLDGLASSAPSAPQPGQSERVLEYVFGSLEFTGNTGDYYSPANSLIHRVLATRRGIPLSLAVIAAEIGRRVDTALQVVGFPGHVLLADGGRPGVWFDPFTAGARLGDSDLQELAARFQPGIEVQPWMTRAMSGRQIAERTLNNLVNAYEAAGMLAPMVAAAQLRADLPGADAGYRRQLAVLLAGAGRYERAVGELEQLMAVDPDNAEAYEREATRLRSHRN